MKIIGCDFHMRYQQIAMLDDETGELSERPIPKTSDSQPSTLSSRPLALIRAVSRSNSTAASCLTSTAC